MTPVTPNDLPDTPEAPQTFDAPAMLNAPVAPEAPVVVNYPTRRDARIARGGQAAASVVAPAPAPAPMPVPLAPAAAAVPAAFTTPAKPAAPKKTPSKADRRSSVLSIAVTAFIVPGLFATVALPAYAYTPTPEIGDEAASAALEEFKASDAQTVFVATGAEAPVVKREEFDATTHAELERARIARTYAAYSGPTTADFLKNPPYPSFSLDQVYAVGLKYLGTPYRYGGSNPSGFDCSGYVQFVYAQFGVSLPHSVGGQSAAGTRISREDARPGDLVIMPGHDGFYAGNGNILDSPRPGGVVSVRPIWTENYYIVRIGI